MTNNLRLSSTNYWLTSSNPTNLAVPRWLPYLAQSTGLGSGAGASIESPRIEIRVRDNGTGIPDAVKDKIFQPFFTTKPTGEGTGLGLSLSYDIITKGHGGMLEVKTDPGLFTEFIVTLPFA